MNWRDRTVLVTGADGFIGSHLVDELLSRGACVQAVVRRTSRSQVTRRFHNLSPQAVASLQSLIQTDLAAPSAVATLGAVQADTWFHLAADAYVPASLTQPTSVIQTNISSTVNVLEAARLAGPRHVLLTSSSEIYGSHDTAITEKYPLRPATPYAASKVACDRISWSYRNTFDVPLTIVRPFNCYGPRHVYDVVPIFLVKALRGEPLLVNGTGSQTRDLTYVQDTVDAFLRLAELAPVGDAYNIGTGTDHDILSLAHLILRMTASKSEIRMAPARPGEVDMLRADATKLRRATGWAPQYSLESGLEENTVWLREHLERV
ncbi:NAD(P)-dependent oxidoreductase [Streptomyces sp. B3I8]|jgi:NDP-hexose 4,6-dehydratase|uniref:NAD-dependent epimerase/dehydratase family protein n=1 Tax=Streptomyces sp. B3I8 TaxID=3042303 RepID=UPI002785BEA1|nr:GDP-mannose 4,6-dehydratase [Streptomyces sp. B3I8]MDQ0790761.1 nucleoside-diphosphate-sugar epimerase [Streptomyces sp. B3I8]